MAEITHESPLAPKAFPDLPEIKGAEFAAVEAGIKYSGRKDVMLARLAPGTAMAPALQRPTSKKSIDSLRPTARQQIQPQRLA